MMSLCFIMSCDECDTVGGPTTYKHLNVGSMITPQSEEKKKKKKKKGELQLSETFYQIKNIVPSLKYCWSKCKGQCCSVILLRVRFSIACPEN